MNGSKPDGRLLPGIGAPAVIPSLAFLAFSVVTGLCDLALDSAARAEFARPSLPPGSISFLVFGGGLESPEAAAARALELARDLPGVSGARILDPVAWEGAAAKPPRLILARSAPLHAAGPAATEARLRSEGLDVRLEPTGLGEGGGFGSAKSLLAVCVVWLVVQAALAAGIGRWSARRAIDRIRERMALLIHLGAPDHALIDPIIGGVSLSAAFGACLGGLMALMVVWGLATSQAAIEMTRVLGFAVPQADLRAAAVAAISPVVALAVSAGISRRLARRAVKTQP